MRAYAPAIENISNAKGSKQIFDVISIFYVCTQVLQKADIFCGLCKRTKKYLVKMPFFNTPLYLFHMTQKLSFFQSCLFSRNDFVST